MNQNRLSQSNKMQNQPRLQQLKYPGCCVSFRLTIKTQSLRWKQNSQILNQEGKHSRKYP